MYDPADETEGRGTRCGEAAFTDQFIGLLIPVTLGEDIDEVSGATITSQAVTMAVNQAIGR